MYFLMVVAYYEKLFRESCPSLAEMAMTPLKKIDVVKTRLKARRRKV
jgi:hypothetical protein